MLWKTGRHVDDRELLLAVDQELPPPRLAVVQDHLAACGECRVRLEYVRRALAALTEASVPAQSDAWSAAGPARARLAARMAEAQSGAPPALLRRGAACATVVVIGAGLTWWLGSGAQAAFTRTEAPVFLPRPDLTPGVTRAVVLSEACGPGGLLPAQPVTGAVQREVFERYGADVTRSADFELDFLVTPELGGEADAHNLWPQPYRALWNAYVKDELEVHLRQLVCAGEMDVATAQREMATDWVAAYKRHFDTDVPRRDYAARPLNGNDAELVRAELTELGVVPPAGETSGKTLLALLQASRPGLPFP